MSDLRSLRWKAYVAYRQALARYGEGSPEAQAAWQAYCEAAERAS